MTDFPHSADANEPSWVACDIPDELGGKRWYDIDVGAMP
jgi:hypothetical protein